jgi:hypothetical protein
VCYIVLFRKPAVRAKQTFVDFPFLSFFLLGAQFVVLLDTKGVNFSRFGKHFLKKGARRNPNPHASKN